MRFKRIRDVLDWTQTFHSQLARQYRELAAGREKERVGLLLDYLADHEKALKKAVQHYEKDADEAILETWYDKAPSIPDPGSLDQLKTRFIEEDVAGIMRLAIDFDDELIEIYESLRSQAPTEEVAELFDNLAQMESHEKKRMVRDALQMDDL